MSVRFIVVAVEDRGIPIAAGAVEIAEIGLRRVKQHRGGAMVSEETAGLRALMSAEIMGK